MNYIDSNIIAYAFYQNKFQENCQKVIKEGGFTNTINLVEAFNIIEFETDRETAVISIRSFLKSSITILDVDINTVFEALKRAQKNKKLKFIDLVHYITASLNNCETIISYDTDFNSLDIKREEPANS